MKILFLTHYDNMYGANRALFQLMKGLKQDYGAEPVLVIPAEGEMSHALAELGIETVIMPVTQWQAAYVTPLRFAVKKWKRKKAIRRELDNLIRRFEGEGIDFIHSNSSVIGTGAMLAKRLGCKHIWHIREFSEEHFHMRYFFPKKQVRELYESAQCLVAISDALRDNYRKKYPGANVIRIYDGVTFREPEDKIPGGETTADNICVGNEPPENKPVNGSNAPVKFIYLGYLFSMKHQLDVVEAANICMEEHFTNFEVYFVGDGKADYRRKLEKRIRKYQLSNVHLKGYLANAQDFLSDMDVGIIASEYEGFGLVTVEYMLHGLPVLGRNSGGTAEIIEDGITGCLFHSVEELARAMKYMMEHPKRRDEMGQAGRQRALAHFTEKNNTDGMMQLYKNCGLEEHGSGVDL